MFRLGDVHNHRFSDYSDRLLWVHTTNELAKEQHPITVHTELTCLIKQNLLTAGYFKSKSTTIRCALKRCPDRRH